MRTRRGTGERSRTHVSRGICEPKGKGSQKGRAEAALDEGDEKGMSWNLVFSVAFRFRLVLVFFKEQPS